MVQNRRYTLGESSGYDGSDLLILETIEGNGSVMGCNKETVKDTCSPEAKFKLFGAEETSSGG